MAIRFEVSLDDAQTQELREAIEVMDMRRMFALLRRSGYIEVTELDMPDSPLNRLTPHQPDAAITPAGGGSEPAAAQVMFNG